MNRIKRYYSALSRYHKSNGFGIHSPFAFYFVLRVLRERSPYYAYQDITELRKTVIAKTIRYGRHPRIISLKNAKLIFRVVNHFNPQHILQIGTSYGISSACILKVSTKSDLVLYEPNLNDYDITNKPLIDKYQVNITDDIKEKIFFKDGKTTVFDLENVINFIEKTSEYDINKIEQEVKNNNRFWNELKNLEKR